MLAWARWLTPSEIPAAARPLLGQLVRKLESWIAAFRVEVMLAIDAGVTECPPPPQPESMVASEPDAAVLDTACAFGMTPASAWGELEVSRQLARMPHLRLALTTGRIGWTQAKAIAQATRWLCDADAKWVDEELARRKLGTLSWRRALNLGRKLAAAADPDGAKERERDRTRVADVRLRALPDGGTLLSTEFGSLDGPIVMAEIERAAAVLEAAGMTGPAARVEAHRRLILAGAATLDACACCGGIADAAARSSRRKAGRMHVQVQVPLDTALGLSNAPGHVVGWGPVSADELRARIFDADLATWTRLVFDPVTGVCVDNGRATYRPPAPLHRFVVDRDGGCTMPTCDHTAADSTIVCDHETEWAAGGTTDPDNLHAADESCHIARHQGGWTITHDASTGTVTWTDRFGNAYVGEMADHRPPLDATPSARRAWLLGLLAQAPRDGRTKREPTKQTVADDTTSGDDPPFHGPIPF